MKEVELNKWITDAYIIRDHANRVFPNPKYYNSRVMRTIALHIAESDFRTLMYSYGYNLLLAAIAYYESREEYEICAEIVRQIQMHNRIANDRIPTRLKRAMN